MTAPPIPQGLSAATIRDALERHYRKPGADRDGEILIPEVQAPGSNRRADLVRVGMWASRGTGIDVHEIKTSRADWRRELDDPAKAEAWWPYCNRFWVVAPLGIVPPEELPEGWGLLEMPASGRRFKARVTAATRTEISLTVPLMVELLRRADNQRLDEIAAIHRQHREDVRKLDQERRDRQARQEISFELASRISLLEQVEKALGVPLDVFGGWPKIPVKQITPAELAAYLADAKEHVTVQRRAEDAERSRKHLRDVAAAVLKHTEGMP